MKNLKRALSFALATVMLIGMMVVGVSAASFGDADEIVNTDAVNTMVALGIIKGKDNGNFDPEGIVTRAEMAKMICVALNGGKDPNLAGGGLYADTKGHWASGYIDYCTNMGIVSGDTAGNFNPDKTVTGTEAAKMILIALGYSAENEKFVNDANWALNINIVANTKDLYKDLAILPAEGLTRDNAAQMLWNGMDAKMVEYDYKLTTVDGELQTVAIAKDKAPAETILAKKFDLTTKYTYMTNVKYDSTDKEFDYTVDATAGFNGTAIATADALTGTTFSLKEDYSDLYGMKVKVLWKDSNSNNKVDAKETVYGIYAVDSEVLFEGVSGKLPATIAAGATEIKISDVTYKLANTASAIKHYPAYAAAAGTLDTYSASDKNNVVVKLIDNTGDGKADIIVSYPFTVQKVTYVGSKGITAGAPYTFEDHIIAEGIAKNDYVMIIDEDNTIEGKDTITKLEVVSGKIDAVKGTSEVRLNGTWYELGGVVATGYIALPTAGQTVDMVIANGYAVYHELADETAALTEVLYVIDFDDAGSDGVADNIAASLGSVYKGKDHLVLFADGTKSTVKAMRVDVIDQSDGIVDGGETWLKTTAVPGLYTYEVNDDGVYELKAVKGTGTAALISTTHYVTNDANQPGNTTFDTNSAGYVRSTAKLDGKFIADDAVIFLHNTADDKVKVVSGKELKTMSNYGTSTSYLYKSVNGLATVQVAVISASGAYSTTDVSTGYGYITTAGYAVKEDSKYTVKFTVWTADGEKELTDVSSSLSADVTKYAKGNFVTYTNTSTEGEVTGVSAYTDANEVAITGWDGSKYIAFNGGSAVKMKDDNKTVVVYIDSANTKGVEGGEIAIASEVGTDIFQKNAVVAHDGSEVDVIFFDVANILKDAGVVVTADATATYDAVAAEWTVGTDAVESAKLTIAAGKKLTIGDDTALAAVTGITAEIGAKLAIANGKVVTYATSSTVKFYSADNTEMTAAALTTTGTGYYTWTLDCKSGTAGNQTGWLYSANA